MTNALQFLVAALGVAFPVLAARAANGNDAAAAELKTIDQEIEDAVVRVDLDFLRKAYADDFTFSHGSGAVQDKKTWLAAVARGYFKERRVDAVVTEFHGNIGITVGRVTIHERVPGHDKHYSVRYIRVYEWRGGRWQMVSNRTTELETLP